MTLVEALDMAETALGRGLNEDEIVLVGRLVDAGKDAADILQMLDKEIVVPVVEDDDMRTYRYEARGSSVARIPGAGAEETAT